MFVFMHIASRICNRFFIIVFIYDYCIICENPPYIGGCNLGSTIVAVFKKTCLNVYVYIRITKRRLLSVYAILFSE